MPPCHRLCSDTSAFSVVLSLAGLMPTGACVDGESSEDKTAVKLAAACMRREEMLDLPSLFLVALYESPRDPAPCIPAPLLALCGHGPDPKRECWHLLQQDVKVRSTHKQQFGIG
jgi:hypothetical protein